MADELVAKISRRSTRVFDGEQEAMESGIAGVPMGSHEARHNTNQDEKDKNEGEGRSSSHQTPLQALSAPAVDVGRDLGTLIPSNTEAIATQVTKSLDAAKALAKEKQDGRPLNFGVVLPNAVYRSSFPEQEDFEYLKTLGLKCIVTLVNKEYPPGFLAFIQAQGIRHYVIEMQGTKKAAIPDHTMNQIMRTCLDKENHPLLIHCNHGKHRTGCAAAIIRHISGWSVQSIVDEYKRFAEPKARDVDIKYITEYQVTSLGGLYHNLNQHPPVPKTSKMVRTIALTTLVVCVCMALSKFWDQ
ncbi:tyrosine-protein phosphatase siw14 [Ciborinia camelliae]|nr:tyrosine-protein phosphatase siw14 [Ciborinia camelliae]